MFGFISKIFGSKPYAVQKKVAKSGSIRQRMKLAKSKKTHPEILYYLAEHDNDPVVRKEVVCNMATPIQASSVLVRDPDVDIRVALADRLVNLWPDIGDDAHGQIYAFAVQSLGVLALDEALKIRIALSSTLKDFANAPPKVVAALAHDVERQVSEPILRYCIALPDEDLIDILKNHPEDWVAEAVAGRPSLSVPVSEVIIDNDNVKAGKVLLDNKNAELSEHVLKHVISKAKDIPEWHESIAKRMDLPPSLAKDLAVFVRYSIREILIERSDFDSNTIRDISDAFERRFGIVNSESELDKKDVNVKSDNKDEVICDAIALRDKMAVVSILSEATKLSTEEIDNILGHKSAKSVVAVCWLGGFTMRTALSIQKDFLKLPVKDLIYPKNGIEYSMSEDEIKWQLDFLGIKS